MRKAAILKVSRYYSLHISCYLSALKDDSRTNSELSQVGKFHVPVHIRADVFYADNDKSSHFGLLKVADDRQCKLESMFELYLLLLPGA